MTKKQARRKRGILLSSSGARRLRQAIHEAEVAENEGQRLTAEALSNRTGVSMTTLGRLWSSKAGVDQRTLRLIFSAFNLELKADDFQWLEDFDAAEAKVKTTTDPCNGYPYGPVSLDSPFYISRPPIETLAVAELNQPGCVVRIKAPTGFGKSSLLLRMMHQAQRQGFAIALIDFQQADQTTLAEPRLCLQWLCMALSLKLGLDPKLEDYWSPIVGDSLSATLYLREYLLTQIHFPVILAINELNRIFEHPSTAQALLPLLRSWHEEAKHDDVWKNLRLVVIYSTEVYLPLDIHQSPFNVGLPLTLPEFTLGQVQKLADLYSLGWQSDEVARLMTLLGGHPTLVRMTLYYLCHHQLALEELLQSARVRQDIYKNHLQGLRARLQDSPHLLDHLQPFVTDSQTVALEPVLAHQLEGLGLIKSVPGGWRISCELYRDYLQSCLFP